MNRRPIHELWVTFAERCIPPSAGPTQRQCMRDAFYAGALSLFQSMSQSVSNEAEPTEGDLALMAAIDADLSGYPERRLEEEP